MNSRQKNFTYEVNIMPRICAHMTDKTDIDKRSFWMTIHLKDGYQSVSDKIIWNIYNSVNYAFKSYTNKHISNKNGMFAAYDFAGTRDRNIDFKSLSVPHIHALIIMNKNIVMNYSKDVIADELIKSISSNILINNHIKNIVIDEYKTENCSLLNYVDYSRKYEKQNRTEMTHLFEHYCYPYDDPKKRHTPEAKEKYRQLTRDMAERILDPESCLFSPEHHDLVMKEYEKADQRYRSAKTDEEKKKHKASFLRGVFSDETIHHSIAT